MNCLYCDEAIPPKREAVLRAWGKEPICLRCAEDTVQPVVASENPADDTGTDFAIGLFGFECVSSHNVRHAVQP